jgi:hypothetical protein
VDEGRDVEEEDCYEMLVRSSVNVRRASRTLRQTDIYIK